MALASSRLVAAPLQNSHSLLDNGDDGDGVGDEGDESAIFQVRAGQMMLEGPLTQSALQHSILAIRG